jgi:hypothetical protein
MPGGEVPTLMVSRMEAFKRALGAGLEKEQVETWAKERRNEKRLEDDEAAKRPAALPAPESSRGADEAPRDADEAARRASCLGWSEPMSVADAEEPRERTSDIVSMYGRSRGLDHPVAISVAASVEALLPTCRAPRVSHIAHRDGSDRRLSYGPRLCLSSCVQSTPGSLPRQRRDWRAHDDDDGERILATHSFS